MTTVDDEIKRWRDRRAIQRAASGLPDAMRDDFDPAVKAAAIAAHAEATRLGMLRVGNPWAPIAAALELSGVVVADATGKRFRTWGHCGPEWTDDIEQATRYVRREDAERACLTDEDGWSIVPVRAPA